MSESVAGPVTGNVRVEDREGGVRVLTLARPKVNALNADFFAEIGAAVDAAKADPAVRAVVLTSAWPKVFSAGLDLPVVSQMPREEFTAFTEQMERVFLEILFLPKPVVAALTGHALAGGGLLASTADFRIASEGPGTIGLPEIVLGVVVPRAFLEAFRCTVGEKALSRWALTGDGMPFPEALSLGALDRIVPADRLLEESVAFAARLARHEPGIYAGIKIDLRRRARADVDAVLEAGRKDFVDSWFGEPARKGIAAQLARLSK